MSGANELKTIKLQMGYNIQVKFSQNNRLKIVSTTHELT